MDSVIHQLMSRQRAKIKALEEASDTGSGARVASGRERHASGKSAPAKVVTSEGDGVIKKETGWLTKPATRQGVRLLQLNPPKTAGSSSVSVNSQNPSLIFNLSHLQNGNGFLILNSLPSSGAESTHTPCINSSSSSSATPLTFVCTRSVASTAHPLATSLGKMLVARDATTDVAADNIECMNGNTESVLMNQELEWREEGARDCIKSPEWNSVFLDNSRKRGNSCSLLTETRFASTTRVSHDNSLSTTSPPEDQEESDNNSMDFTDGALSTADDLFSLEAFDLLSQEMTDNFSGLEDLTALASTTFRADHHAFPHQNAPCNNSNNNNNNHSCNSNTSSSSGSRRMDETRADLAAAIEVANPRISDYSPEWSYPDGGMKVLVAGPWYSSQVQYEIIFDGISVPTSLVQNGVLRCFSPAHEAGFVSLQVAVAGRPISDSVIFEYREISDTPSGTTAASDTTCSSSRPSSSGA